MNGRQRNPLPANPNLYSSSPAQHVQNYGAPPPAGAMAAQAVMAALSNPYAQQQNYAYSSHYAQAYQSAQYAQAYSVIPNVGGYYRPNTNAQGYTISSTYAPGPSSAGPSGSYPAPQTSGSSGGIARTPGSVSRPAPGSANWYSPGNCRCGHDGCSFVGSEKSVEIHKMDRHLVYPLGWEKRKRQQDWDADPSLKGKKVPIQGTNLVLDTPEALEAWIEERKKRWPTGLRVDDKKRKVEEAVARGQLNVEDPFGGHRKRRRTDDAQGGVDGFRHDGGGRGRGGPRGRGRGRGRGQEGGQADGGWRGRGRGGQRGGGPPRESQNTQPLSLALPAKPLAPLGNVENSGSSSDSDVSDDAPEAVSSKAPVALLDQYSSSEEEQEHEQPAAAADPSKAAAPVTALDEAEPASQESLVKATALQPIKKPRPQQPRRPPPNPFAPRRSLLRNLLVPEIRMTVSNLSQAIRFLVDNDFLKNVELTPGQAEEKMIEVIGSADTKGESAGTRDEAAKARDDDIA